MRIKAEDKRVIRWLRFSERKNLADVVACSGFALRDVLRVIKNTKSDARHELKLAIRRGIIKRGPCVECGTPKADAHHNDYLQPLEVVWLCRLHHEELHRLAGCVEL